MDEHTFPAADADRLDDAARRYRTLSAEELYGAVDPEAGDAVVDLGSGTGFYTDELTPHVAEVAAVDVQPAMHDRYREKGVPENVTLVTAGADDLPFADDRFAAAVSTMTLHELPEAAVTEAARVLRSGGRFVVVDWTAEGRGERGPPLAERTTADEAAALFREAGFEVTAQATRAETFLLVGVLGE